MKILQSIDDIPLSLFPYHYFYTKYLQIFELSAFISGIKVNDSTNLNIFFERA